MVDLFTAVPKMANLVFKHDNVGEYQLVCLKTYLVGYLH